MTVTPSLLLEPTFWRQPLADRMSQFAELRELGAVLPVEVDNPITETTEVFHALTIAAWLSFYVGIAVSLARA